MIPIPKTSNVTPRVAVSGIIHETHSFAETRSTLTDFQNQSLYFGEKIVRTLTGTRSVVGGLIQEANTLGWTLLPTAYGAAMPGGIVTEAAYQAILQEMLDRLTSLLPIDGLLLALHDAMVTEEHLDPESHILEQVRHVVGPELPIVVVLDMHGNISPRSVELADVLVAFDTNPHIDPHARGVEAVGILKQLLNQAILPTTAYIHPPVLLAPQATGTADLPLQAVHERVVQMEAEDEVICICIMAGFAYADTPFSGTSVIVTTDNCPELAQRYAQELADIIMCHRQAAQCQALSPEEAVAQAVAHSDGPIILVDSADNIGGGNPWRWKRCSQGNVSRER